MNKKIFTLFIFSLFSTALFSQNADSIAQAIADGKKPVMDPWGSTMLVDAQTTLIPTKGSLELIIQHRFSNFNNGIKDLFGIYGASNIRMALSYSIIDQLSVGFSTEKDNKYQEFFAKVKILDQNRSGSMPVSLTFFGNASISGQPKSYYGLDSTYKFADRMSYFAQLILSRKFCKEFSLEVAGSWSHINKIESVKMSDTTATEIITSYKPLYMNDIFGITAGAKFNFYNGHSILLEYDQGFFTQFGQNQMLFPKPNLALAYEIATSTHCFQVFCSSYRGLNDQQNFVKNQMDFTKKGGLMIGFNITVRLR
jgi:hypothetical protein